MESLQADGGCAWIASLLKPATSVSRVALICTTSAVVASPDKEEARISIAIGAASSCHFCSSSLASLTEGCSAEKLSRRCASRYSDAGMQSASSCFGVFSLEEYYNLSKQSLKYKTLMTSKR